MKEKKFSKLTKIVATVGPASDSRETLAKLIKSGVNVFRFNTKHGTPEWHEKRIQLVQAIANELKTNIGILIDLQGPEIRLETKNTEDITLKKNQELLMGTSFTEGVSIVIPHKAVINSLEKGDEVLIDDGHVSLIVKERFSDFAMITAKKDVVLKNRKGVNLPGKRLDLPSLISSDLKQLDMASLNKVDFIALSFARDKRDIDILRTEMKKRKISADIITKVENQEALDHIDELIAVSDGIMVARGDLGVEVPIEKLLYYQKMIIDKCKQARKPVITATEMLDSMIKRPRPTRAEATDVSNAVFEGTDAVMLSGETAQGEYPVEAVHMMARIAKFTESVKEFEVNSKTVTDATQLIGTAAMQMVVADGVEVDKIVVFTQTGYTARVISSFRPDVPIIAVTNEQSTVEKLCLVRGVYGYKFTFPSGRLVSPDAIISKLGTKGAIMRGETVLIVHGARWKKPGLTNTITLITY